MLSPDKKGKERERKRKRKGSRSAFTYEIFLSLN